MLLNPELALDFLNKYKAVLSRVNTVSCGGLNKVF